MTTTHKTEEWVREWGLYKRSFKGTEAQYIKLHDDMRLLVPLPKVCAFCGEADKLQLANLSSTYSTDVKDWAYLCPMCHRRQDSSSFRANGSQWEKQCKKCQTFKLLSEYYSKYELFYDNGRECGRIVYTQSCKNCSVRKMPRKQSPELELKVVALMESRKKKDWFSQSTNCVRCGKNPRARRNMYCKACAAAIQAERRLKLKILAGPRINPRAELLLAYDRREKKSKNPRWMLCKRGHPLDDGNVIIRIGKGRQCKRCTYWRKAQKLLLSRPQSEI